MLHVVYLARYLLKLRKAELKYNDAVDRTLEFLLYKLLVDNRPEEIGARKWHHRTLLLN